MIVKGDDVRNYQPLLAQETRIVIHVAVRVQEAETRRVGRMNGSSKRLCALITRPERVEWGTSLASSPKHLFQLVAKQVEDRGLVVWYDPEGPTVRRRQSLTLPNTTVARYDGSFLKLRHEIDHAAERPQPPRLVVYVPDGPGRDRPRPDRAGGGGRRHAARPAAARPQHPALARRPQRPPALLGEDQAAEIEKQVEAGKLTWPT